MNRRSFYSITLDVEMTHEKTPIIFDNAAGKDIREDMGKSYEKLERLSKIIPYFLTCLVSVPIIFTIGIFAMTLKERSVFAVPIPIYVFYLMTVAMGIAVYAFRANITDMLAEFVIRYILASVDDPGIVAYFTGSIRNLETIWACSCHCGMHTLNGWVRSCLYWKTKTTGICSVTSRDSGYTCHGSLRTAVHGKKKMLTSGSKRCGFQPTLQTATSIMTFLQVR